MSRDEIDMHAPVAQLDRALDSDSKGRWFESSRAYHINETVDASGEKPGASTVSGLFRARISSFKP